MNGCNIIMANAREGQNQMGKSVRKEKWRREVSYTVPGARFLAWSYNSADTLSYKTSDNFEMKGATQSPLL